LPSRAARRLRKGSYHHDHGTEGRQPRQLSGIVGRVG
jgi:hypothetical protein